MFQDLRWKCVALFASIVTAAACNTPGTQIVDPPLPPHSPGVSTPGVQSRSGIDRRASLVISAASYSSALASTTQATLWYYFQSPVNNRWYIVNSSGVILMLDDVGAQYSGNIGWRPINSAAVAGYATAGVNFATVTLSADGSTVSIGATTSSGLPDDAQVLQNSQQHVAWLYFDEPSTGWYITEASSAAQLYYLAAADPSIDGGIGWEPVFNASSPGYPDAGATFAEVTLGAGRRSTVFGPAAAATGDLSVVISGLPGNASASVTVSGPNQFSGNVFHSTTFSGIAPGSYQVLAQNVTANGAQYTPSPATVSAAVTPGGTATVAITYAASGATGTSIAPAISASSADPFVGSTSASAVTLTGQGFMPGLQVRFGRSHNGTLVAPSTTSIQSVTQLTATVSLGLTAASWTATVTTSAGTSAPYPFRVVADDYPASDRYVGFTPADCRADGWNFCMMNCTSFVAWRVTQDGVTGFNDQYKGVHWGDASNWDVAAQQAGMVVDHVPAIGAVAQFKSIDHVAYVAAVYGDGTMMLEEYNYHLDGAYDRRVVSASSVSEFIHVR